MSNQNLDQWQAAIDENQNYIKLGRAMQQRGTIILNSIPITKENIINLKSSVDTVGIAKLMDAATKAIERGAALESKARENLRRLYACKPIDWAGQGH